MKYSKDEILQMLISQYHFQTKFDPNVFEDVEPNYEFTIFEWRDACDLLNPTKLAKIYHEEFKIKRPILELETLLKNEDINTLNEFCYYISQHAERETIEPINLFGQNCQTASIFRTLKNNLTKKGVDTTYLKPSAKISNYFLKNGGIIFDEVNRIAPGTMSKFEYKVNKTEVMGNRILFFTIIFGIAFWKILFFHWLLLLPIVIGIIVSQIGMKKEPEKLNFGGFENFRELIYGMEKQLKKASIQQSAYAIKA